MTITKKIKPITVYVGGAFRTNASQIQKENIIDIDILSEKVIRLSDGLFMPVFPHLIAYAIQDIHRRMKHPISNEWWVEYCNRMMEPCESAIFHWNWESSEGSRDEIDNCELMRKPWIALESINHNDEQIVKSLDYLKDKVLKVREIKEASRLDFDQEYYNQ